MDFAAIVLQRLKELDLNVNQAEANAGFPQGYIRGVVRADSKRAIPNINKADEIARSLGMELYIGPPRELGPIDTVVPDHEKFARIPVHQASLAAGVGALNDCENVAAHVVFCRNWLRSVGVAASSAVMASVTGDSMSPTIEDRDVVLIDTSKVVIDSRGAERKKKRPPIYAFVQDGLARVKRIERVDTKFYALISDNAEHSIQFLSEDAIQSLSIIGKVVWWSRTSFD